MLDLDLLSALGLVFLVGLSLGKLAQCLHLPPLLGYLLGGMLLGQSGFQLLAEPLGELSPILRQIALLMILLKAGLSLSWDSLKTVGRPALLLSFCPASFEMFSCLLFAPLLFGLSLWESALLGTVLAAVSPAVVVPRMAAYVEAGVGKEHKAPEMVLAGASLDDVLVIFLFSTLVSMDSTASPTWAELLQLPLSLVCSILLGLLLGKGLSKLCGWLKAHGGGEDCVLLLLGLSFLLLGAEESLPLSALLTVMVLGMVFEKGSLSQELSQKFSSLWKGAELLLFVLVGGEVLLHYAWEAGLSGLLLLSLGLLSRCVGVWLATCGTALSKAERGFVMLSYLPKATVQAGIGGIPLAMGLDCGALVLTLAVLSIVVTAPVGAICLDRYGASLLE